MKKELGRGDLLEVSHDLLKQCEGCAELLPFVFGEALYGTSEGLYAAFARFPHEADAFRRRLKADAAGVFGGMSADQSGALEAGDDAAHRWRSDVFSVGKLTERSGTAEDEDGERRKLGWADVGFAVADTKPSQQMDGSGVELVGDFGCYLGRR